VKAVQYLLTIVYIAYLVNAGLLLVLTPWHPVWPLMLLHMPPQAAALLDQPWLRGLLSAFGILHLLLALAELLPPKARRAL